jgi:hypothetical protein
MNAHEEFAARAGEKYRERQRQQEEGRVKIKIETSAEFAEFTPPDYLVDGLLIRKFLYSNTAITGGGKTAVALLLAAHVALGRSLGDMEIPREARVLYLAGENYIDVQMRWVALCDELGLKPKDLDLRFIRQAGPLSEVAEQIKEQVGTDEYGLLIIDTSVAYAEHEDENGNREAHAHAKRMRTLTELPGWPAVLANTHPIKNAKADDLVPRGGGAFLAEVDGNLCLKKVDDTTVELHWQGKFRGPDFAPKLFRIRQATHPKLVDKNGRQLTTVVAEIVGQDEARQAASQANADENALMIAIKNSPRQPCAQYARTLGWVSVMGIPDTKKVTRIANRLIKEKLAARVRDRLRLTKKGAEEVA